MKRIISSMLVVVMLLAMVFTLASCSNISESYANKINKAAEEDKHFTKAQVLEDLGDEAFEANFLVGSVIVAVAGCDSLEDVQAKIDNGETVKGIIVTIFLDKATHAKYGEIKESDLK